MSLFSLHLKTFFIKRVIFLCAIVAGFAFLALRFFLSVSAAEVPFGSEILVISSFDGAYSVSSADFDLDGDLDILGVAQLGQMVAWWENTTGDGTVWSASNILTATLPGAIQAISGDLNGDGAPDVVAASATTGQVYWWDNVNQDGSVWDTRLIDAFLAQTTGIYIVDINQDGALDVAAVGTVGSNESVLWFENSGDGSSWTRRTVAVGLLNPTSIASADLDRDGNSDLIVTSESADEISWWRNIDGTGLNWAPSSVSSFYADASGVAVGDVDGDGDPDLVTSYESDEVISWRENDGNGQVWTDHPFATTLASPVSVAVFDVDGDGDLDALGMDNLNDQVLWWENTESDGTTWQEYSIASSFDGARTVQTADVNGDGLVDVLGAAENAERIVWWKNTSIHRNAYFPNDATIVVDGNLSGAFSIGSADFDRDGNQDLVAGSAGTGEVAWYRNNLGNGTNWTKSTVGSVTGVRSVYMADLDGDGDQDVIGAGTGVSDVVWWANDGNGTFGGASFIDNSFSGAFWVSAGDVDGDGDMDVLGAAFGGGLISWWQNNGSGSFGTQVDIETTFAGATSVAVADFDDDGDLDVVGSSYTNNTISWWENIAGDGSVWDPNIIDNAIGGPVSTFPADVDGDGDFDVLGASNVAQEFSWWENTDGEGTFNAVQVVIGANFDNAESVHGADMDMDGDMDVIGAAQNDNTVVWFENIDDGNGQSWAEHILTSSLPEAVAVNVADVDSNGQPDVLAAANVANQVRWWGNRGGQFSLPTVDTSPGAIVEGETFSIMSVTFDHNGRAFDSDMELATLEFLFEETPGNALGEPEANAIIENLWVYLDDGSGDFEENQDTLVMTVSELAVVGGLFTLDLPDAEPNVQLAAGETKVFFIVMELTPDAGTQTPNEFILTHLTNEPTGNSSAIDVNAETSLTMAYAPNILSELFIFAPDLFIEKYANELPVLAHLSDLDSTLGGNNVIGPGEPITYTIVYSNTANTSATGVSITDVMPPEAVFSDYSFTGFTPTLEIQDENYIFDIGTVPPDQGGSITILAGLSITVTQEYVFNNTAILTGFLLGTEVDAASDADLEINLPPFVDAGLDQTVSVGQTFVLTAHFSDVGLDDTHLALIDWGDGSSPTPGIINQDTDTVAASHQYSSIGEYEIKVTVADSDGGIGEDVILVFVEEGGIFLPIVIKP